MNMKSSAVFAGKKEILFRNDYVEVHTNCYVDIPIDNNTLHTPSLTYYKGCWVVGLVQNNLRNVFLAYTKSCIKIYHNIHQLGKG